MMRPLPPSFPPSANSCIRRFLSAGPSVSRPICGKVRLPAPLRRRMIAHPSFVSVPSMLIEGIRSSAVLGMGLMFAYGLAQAGDPGAPPAEQHIVTDTYHGVQVSDPYRWLEDPNSSEVREWSEAQDQRTRKYLDALPQRAPIYNQLLRQISATSSS